MSARISKLAFIPPSMAAEATCGSQIPAAGPAREASSFGQLLNRFWSDEQLAEELQAGNADALTELFRRHGGLLYHIARCILRSEEEAEDVVQQVFLDVFRSINRFDAEKGQFKTWLFMFAHQRALNHRRNLTADRYFAMDSLEESMPGLMVRNPGKYSPAEAQILVEQTLASLPARQRRTIELVYFAGFTAEEVSRQTGETVRVVRHNLYRGLDRLRRIFCDETPSRAPELGEPR